MSHEKREYKIGSKVFTQNKLMLGQLEQLLGVFADVGVSVDENFAIREVIKKLGASASKLLAILLIEEGVELEKKDVPTVENFLRWNFNDEEVAERILIDFFAATPIFSLLKMPEKIMMQVSGSIKKELEKAKK